MQSKNVVAALGLTLAAGGMLLSGCTASASISVQKGPVKATGTVSTDHTCATKAKCADEGGVFMKFAQSIEHFFVPEAMASTTIFDASSGRLDIATSNVSLTTTSGTGSVVLYSNGTAVASTTVNYYRSGNSLYVSNPSAVNAWVTTYQGAYDTFAFTVNNLQYTPTTTADTTAKITASMYYNGDLQAAGSTSYEINASTGGCGIGVNCKQQ